MITRSEPSIDFLIEFTYETLFIFSNSFLKPVGSKYLIKAPFFDYLGIMVRLDESLISSVFALKVTPRKVIFLFLTLFFKIL